MRKVLFYEDHFMKFYRGLPTGDQRKMEWVLRLVEELDRIPANYMKYLTAPGIYELRITHKNQQYRICCFFDSEHRLILINAFIKKSRKTPVGEIKKAIKIYKQYYHEKKKREDQ